MSNVSRRALLLASAAGAAMAAPGMRIRLGGPIFLKSDDPRELAREHRRLGYSAAYCPQADVKDAVRTREIEKAFAAENVAIAEVGAWKNMLDPDPAARRENLRYVTERLALAEAVNARCCVDIAGSYNPKVWYGPHPKNFSKEFFDATVENCRKVIDEVKPARTKFTIEMMGWAIPNDADSYLKLLKAVDRKPFAVHIDVCNGISSPEKFYENAAFIKDCFRKLGPWITSCHAKDLDWLPEMNVHFVEVIPGRGSMDYRTYLSELARLEQDAPLMLEHLKTAEEYDEGKRYIQRVAGEIGVSFY
ncbi:MAG: sugar phosphate isomerase/epimerase [Bryobacteraceae bacterium]|nr:sugar phosphate isomerase/epimerase [Bryobacteraceae bacterium]